MNGQEDFRPLFYSKYVSKFKRENLVVSEADDRAYARWADYHYYPHLSHLRTDAAILDLGCGPGRTLAYLRSKGHINAKGIDLSAEQVAVARSRGLDAFVGDIGAYLSSTQDLYDAMIMIDVVEHLTKTELLTLFPLISSRLKPGGVIVIQTVNGEGLFPLQIMYGDFTHVTYLTASSIEQLLLVTGFARVTALGTPPVPRGFRGILRSLAWKLIEFEATMVRRIETGKRHRIWTENMVVSARKAD
jgi:2-polyprenyl-3-methyl-5-hydroxy-6-metoxy-1,4-benzoquinol methylase